MTFHERVGASSLIEESSEGQGVRQVVQTTVVHGEHLEKHEGDSVLAVDLPSARDDFTQVGQALNCTLHPYNIILVTIVVIMMKMNFFPSLLFNKKKKFKQVLKTLIELKQIVLVPPPNLSHWLIPHVTYKDVVLFNVCLHVSLRFHFEEGLCLAWAPPAMYCTYLYP